MIAFLLSCSQASAQTITEARLAEMLRTPGTTIRDEDILADLKGCIAFVPTETRVARLMGLRASIAPALEERLKTFCLGPADSGTKIDATGEDVLWLSKHDRANDITRLVHACPSSSGSTIRALATSRAADTVVEHIAGLCEVNLRPARWLLAVNAGMSPLYAAKQIQQEDMDFTGGLALEAKFARRVSPAVLLFTRLAYNIYTLDPAIIDDLQASSFKQLTPSAGIRLIGSCLIRHFCGSFAVGRNDLFVDGDIGWTWLRGDKTPPQLGGRSIHFSFKGLTGGIGGGYLRRVSSSWDLEFAAGYRVIGFKSVHVSTIDRQFGDNIGGISGEPHVGVTFQYGFGQ